MGEKEWLAEQFESNRTHLRAVAYRMLGSASDADDAVQDARLRLSRSDPVGSTTWRDGSRQSCPGLPRHAAFPQVPT
jgi:DNA-directed RNA polymerase specialized sigma24 family protein